MTETYDLAIIGASLAGLNVAYHAKKYHPKAKILLVDKREEIGFPVKCGEATFLNALEKCGDGWKRIGTVLSARDNLEKNHCKTEYGFRALWMFEDFNKELLGVVANRIEYLKAIFPGGHEKTLKLKYMQPVILNRDKFEQYLYNRLNEWTDIDVRLNTKVRQLYHGTHQRTGKHIHWNIDTIDLKNFFGGGPSYLAKTIIAADGMNSVVAKCAGMKQKYSPNDFGKCIQDTVLLKEKLSDKEAHTTNIIFDFNTVPRGYGWIFPKSNKILNIGIGVLGGQKLDLKSALHFFEFKYVPIFEKRLKRFRANVPLALPSRIIDEDRKVLLAGDAGNFVISSSAGGIATSLWTGMMAGRYFDKPKKYYSEVRSFLIPKLEYAYNLKQTFQSEDISKALSTMRKFRWLLKLHSTAPRWVERKIFSGHDW